MRTVVSGNAACHSVIITEEGRVMTWGLFLFLYRSLHSEDILSADRCWVVIVFSFTGRNDKGQLGHGDTKRRDHPSYVEELKDVIAVDAACGRSHTLILSGMIVV